MAKRILLRDNCTDVYSNWRQLYRPTLQCVSNSTFQVENDDPTIHLKQYGRFQHRATAVRPYPAVLVCHVGRPSSSVPFFFFAVVVRLCSEMTFAVDFSRGRGGGGGLGGGNDDTEIRIPSAEIEPI